LGHCFLKFVGDVKRVWPGPGREGLVLLQVGVSVPIDTLTQPCIPVSAATYARCVYYVLGCHITVVTCTAIAPQNPE